MSVGGTLLAGLKNVDGRSHSRSKLCQNAVPLFAVLFGGPLNRFGRERNAYTLADFLVHRYGPAVRRPAPLAAAGPRRQPKLSGRRTV